MLVTGQRCQSIHLMDLEHISKGKSSYKFYIDQLVKQSKPGKTQPVLVLPGFPADRRLCVATYLEEYITRTKPIRSLQNTRLFLSFCKPYKPVTASTISRWIKTVMAQSGVDVKNFRPHSTRSASTSAALRKGVPLNTIMEAAGWSSHCTFATYYRRETKADTDYGTAILSCAT